MRTLLATRYQRKPRYQPGCDGWVNVVTGEEGTWETKDDDLHEKTKEVQADGKGNHHLDP